jgi:peptidoglycan/xylan/chitin deacetylase (PgdA/CDA1 family)
MQGRQRAGLHMSWRTNGLKRVALSALHFSGADGLMAPLTRGAGVIFSLHHVGAKRQGAGAPDRTRTVTPEFLDAVVGLVRERGFDVLSLDDVHFRLSGGDLDRPFACFTFDVGYKDVLHNARPIFRKHGLPFAIYLASDYVDGRGDPWWLALEMVVGVAKVVELKMDGVVRRLACATAAEKAARYHELHRWLRGLAEDDARQIVAELCRAHGVDTAGLCRSAVLGWDEVKELSRDRSVTIGAHTRRHYALSGLSVASAQLEIEASVQRIESELGLPCRHFSYPYGDIGSACQRDFDIVRELGFETAVTARKDLVRARHSRELTALPRIALNGEFQHARYVKVMLSGIPYVLSNGVRSVQRRTAAAR